MPKTEQIPEILLFSNNCVAGHFYKRGLKTEFQHPIIWTLTKLTNFLSFIENFDTINLFNTKFFQTEGEIRKDPCAIIKPEYYKKCSTMEIDGKVRCYFIHHTADDREETIRENGVVHGKNVLRQLADAYVRRSQRMEEIIKAGNCPIVFVYTDDVRTNDTDVMKFIECTTPYKKIFVTHKQDFKKYENDGLMVFIPSEHGIRDIYEELGKYMAENEEIQDFIYGNVSEDVSGFEAEWENAIEYAISKIGVAGLANPKTIQEKLFWLNCFDQTELKSECADKLRLRDYCKRVLKKDLCPKILGVYDNPDEIDFSKLPPEFVLKCNHGSGFNKIFDGTETINAENVRKEVARWLSTNYCTDYWHELQYYNIKPKCFSEELIRGGATTS